MNTFRLLLSLSLPFLVLTQDVDSKLSPEADHPHDASDAGAAGTAKGDLALSSSAMAAIIVVAILVVVLGST